MPRLPRAPRKEFNKDIKIIPKSCRFCEDGIEVIDYKDLKTLQRYITSYGRIEARSRSGTCMRHQRKLAQSLKRARQVALLPFTTR